MADPAPNLALAFNLPPEKAVEYFQSKGLRISSSWKDLSAQAHARSFTVAGVLKADVLADIQGALEQAIEQGTTFEDFVKTLRPQLKAKGWWGIPHDPETGEVLPGRAMTPYRLRTVFQTNVQASYMAGRMKGMVEASDSHPYWQYVAILDNRTRPRHRALAGRVFRWDDPIWKVIFPPNGYKCRCRVRPLTEGQLQMEGLSVSSGADHMETITVDLGPRGGKAEVTGFRDPATGEFFGPDVGFDYAPADAWRLDVDLARKVSAIKSRDIRQQTWQALNNSPARQAAYWNWAESVLDAARPGNTAQVVGFVPDDIADFMQQNDQEPIRVAVINEKRLVHADSIKHREGGIALARDQYAMLPGIMAQPDAVYYDTKHAHFVYVRNLVDDEVIFVALDAAETVKRAGRLDALVNAFRLPGTPDGVGRLADGNRFIRMKRGGQ